MNITLVIPIYNRLDITKEGLTSIDNAIKYYQSNGQGRFVLRMVIVDDGSTDGSSKWIKENFQSVIILQGSGNLWWSGSVNVGARYAIETLGTDYVVLWNDDTKCAEDFFLVLENLLLSDKQYQDAILVSKVYWQHKPNFLFNFGCYFNHSTGKKTLIGLNKEDNYNEIIPVDWSGGMGTIIPAHILLTVNYFDNEKFPQYHGDSDFFLRAKESGFKAYAIPDLKIYNNIDSTGINSVKNLRELKALLTSIKSFENIKQNFYFNLRHANSVISWFNFSSHYLLIIGKLLLNRFRGILKS